MQNGFLQRTLYEIIVDWVVAIPYFYIAGRNGFWEIATDSELSGRLKPR